MPKQTAEEKSLKNAAKARTALQAECDRYHKHLYKEKDFSEFRFYVQDQLDSLKKQLEGQVEQNKKLNVENQLDHTTVKKQIEELTTLLSEPDNVQLAANCFKAKRYRTDYLTEKGFHSVRPDTVEKILALNELQNCLLGGEHAVSLINNFAQLSHNPDPVFKYHPVNAINDFSQLFQKKEDIFKKKPDSAGIIFLKVVLHTLATLFTGFIYPVARAGYSLYTKNSAAFWRSREELLEAEMKRAVKAAKAVKVPEVKSSPKKG